MSSFSANYPTLSKRRILSLQLPRLPTDRVKRLHIYDDDSVEFNPHVVITKKQNTIVIIAVDDNAAKIGLEPGLSLAHAQAICSDLKVIDEDKAADTQTLNDIANWCDRFTPLVALDFLYGLFLDITGCDHLFGSERNLIDSLCHSLNLQGFIVNAAIAGTAVCARTMARAVAGAIVADGEEAAAVSPLPVYALGADNEITRGLRRAGLKTIGDVVARTPSEITARFGASFTALLQEAIGQSASPINPRKPLPDYLVEKRFAEPIATALSISSTLRLLADKLILSMERYGKGARLIEANFFRTDGVVRTISVEAGHPVTQTQVIIRLFRERLETLADPIDPGFGFDLIRLSASHVESVNQEQRDFDTRTHDDAELFNLIDRIAARIGTNRIIAYLPQDTHIPEQAAVAAAAQVHLSTARSARWTERIKGEPPLRPLRLFDKPEPVKVIAEVPDGPPMQFVWRRLAHRVVLVEGPERIASEWWHKKQKLTRDYFRVEDAAGMRFWLYRDGLYDNELTKTSEDGKRIPANWFIHGTFA